MAATVTSPPSEPSASAIAGPQTRIGWIATIEAVAKALPVAILMLPLAGAVYRWISFSNGFPYVPGFVAGHMPVTQLAAVAATDVLPFPVATTVLLLPVVMFLRWQQTRVDSDRLSRTYKLGIASLLVGILALVAVLVALSLVLSGTVDIVGLGAFVISFVVWLGLFWILTQPPYPVGLGRIVAAVAVLVIYSGVVSGLSLNQAGTYIVEIATTADAKFSEGRYVLLGEADGAAWLLPCLPDADEAAAIRVPVDAIAAMQAIRVDPVIDIGGFNPNLSYVLPDPPGFTPRCY